MSQKNDEAAIVIAVLAVILTALYVITIVALFALLIATFIYTALALYAWNKPRRIGNEVLLPEEARAFVYRGLLFAVVCPILSILCGWLFDLPLDENLLPLVSIAGYIVGSMGFEYLREQGRQSAQGFDHTVLPYAAPEPKVLPSPPKEPFHYASWDDEEENGR